MFAFFPLGQVVATSGALAALERAREPADCFLARHATGDWGTLDPEDVAAERVQHGSRVSVAEQPNRRCSFLRSDTRTR